MAASEDFWATLPGVLKDLTNDANTDMSSIRQVLYPAQNPMPSYLADTTQSSEGSSNVPVSPPHRYKDQDGLKAALRACFAQLKLTPADGECDILAIPYDAIETACVHQAFRGRLGSPLATAGDIGLVYLWKFLLHTGNLQLWGTRLRDLFAATTDEDDDVDKIPSFALEERTSQLVRMFTTASGYVGLALCDLQVGDEIYVLGGCAMPVALRPSSKCVGGFELLGGVFVAGLMRGEAVTEHLASGRPVEEIILC
jgi:hypothetical protein